MTEMTKPAPSKEKAYCNVAAQALGLDPGGDAGHFDDAVLIETALPWKRELYEKAGVLPQEAIDLLALWLERYQETGVYGHRPLLIAPDDEYSQVGYRRVIYYERPQGLFASFDRNEYLVPNEDLGLLLWALFEDKETLPQFDGYRVHSEFASRDILVCTHGTIDVACAKFGYPLYKMMRDDYAGQPGYEGLRVWRVSHFGGHVFAPTLMDMPTGHYWAYVGEAQARQLVERSGTAADLYEHYRGWAGLPRGFVQAAEREMWQDVGWSWFDYAKQGSVTEQEQAAGDDDAQPQWADVSVQYTDSAGIHAQYNAHVEVARTVETLPSTDYEKTYPYPQYEVTALSKKMHHHGSTNGLTEDE